MTTAKHIPIRVRRFHGCPTHQLSIEPEDRSWVLYVDHEGKPSLWLDIGPIDVPADPDGDETKGMEHYESALMVASLAYEAFPDLRSKWEQAVLDKADAEPMASDPIVLPEA